jgi:hypothetical protein
VTCHEASEKLLDLSYGELPAAEARDLRAHLDSCAGCRAEAARIEETRGLYRRAGEEPAPAGEGILLAAARQATEAARPARGRLSSWARLATALAVVAVAGGVAFQLISSRREDRAEEAWAARRQAPASAAPAEAAREPSPPADATLDRAPPAAAVRERAAPSARPAAGAAAAEAPAGKPAPAAAGELAFAPRAAPAAPAEAEAERKAARPAAGLPPPGGVSARGAALQREARPAGPAERETPAASAFASPPPGAGAPARTAKAEASAPPAPDAEEASDRLVLELRRARDAGELNEARRHPDPCPGGDVLRVAWLDGWGKARRLAITGPLPAALGEGQATRDQYYDQAGRLRLAVIDGTAAAGRFRRRIVLDEAGRRVLEDPPGSPWPAEDLVLRDPAGAFWAPTRCAPPAR